MITFLQKSMKNPLIEKQGGKVAACEFLIDLVELGGKDALKGYDVRSVMQFTESE